MQATGNKTLERRCLVNGDSGDTFGLIRFAISPDGVVVPDLAERLPGRGLWVTASKTCLQQALDKKLFSRAAKESVTAPADLVTQTAALLGDRVLNALGLAKKSSLLAIGADAVKEEADRLAIVLIASDASTAGRADAQKNSAANMVLPIDAATLGTALGRDSAVYIGVIRDKSTLSLLRDCTRLLNLV